MRRVHINLTIGDVVYTFSEDDIEKCLLANGYEQWYGDTWFTPDSSKSNYGSISKTDAFEHLLNSKNLLVE
ncbi:MAG: hypothetical protein R3230_00175 [Nitrosopumilaceae archaeon]|nr:hypothetical protein [Nitrosopumilaceae archaeon]